MRFNLWNIKLIGLGRVGFLDLIHDSNVIVLLFMGPLISHVEKPDSNSRKAIMD
jgi:hypothetical protein